MSGAPRHGAVPGGELVAGQTFHGRRGDVANAFRYGVDYFLVDPEAPVGTRLFSRNRPNLASLWDRDHGGQPGRGRGAAWLREVLAAEGVDRATGQVLLLAQPRILGHVFNPVSFWLCHDEGGALVAVMAEVSNTYGDRHCYLCRHDDQRPIAPTDRLHARKIFHVSPFQPVEGEYVFRFDVTSNRIGIWIDYQVEAEGLLATLTGRRRPLTDVSLLVSLLRRPFGSRRVLALIHWQALKLWRAGARWRSRPAPPGRQVSR